MFDSVLPAESEPISVVSSRWLRAARCFALICTIALGVGFVAEAAVDQDGLVALIFFGRWGSLSLALLYLLFRRGKNSLAFALGLGAATAFIVLLPVASMLSRSGRHLAFFIVVFSGILPPLANLMNGLHPQLTTLGALLLWLFSISLAMLGLSSIVAFQKMAHEAKGMGKLRLAFSGGMCCALVVWLIFMLLGLFFGGFRI
jgi:amino acid transporter